MTAAAFVFPGVETSPDPVDGALCDAVAVALHAEAGTTPDIAAIAHDLRAELRRMDIEVIGVVRLEDSRRRSDVVALATYTQVLAQRNAALKELGLYHARPADDASHQLAEARRLVRSMQDDVAAASAQLAASDREIARLKAEIDGLKATEGR